MIRPVPYSRGYPSSNKKRNSMVCTRYGRSSFQDVRKNRRDQFNLFLEMKSRTGETRMLLNIDHLGNIPALLRNYRGGAHDSHSEHSLTRKTTLKPVIYYDLRSHTLSAHSWNDDVHTVRVHHGRMTTGATRWFWRELAITGDCQGETF